MDLDERQQWALPRNQSGKACNNCARIKCKCIFRGDGQSCERCYRLKKNCIPSPSEKRRGPRRQGGTRSARLEEKLDDIVSLLRTQHIPVEPDQGDAGGDDSDNNGTGSREDSFPASTTLSSIATFGDVYTDEPSPMEAEDTLKRFREQMLPFTPFLHIAPHETSFQMRHTYPFLWLNIMSVASKSAKTRNSLGDQSRRLIVHRVVADGERSLDILLGTLTFLYWGHMFLRQKHFTTFLSQLIVTMIWDLGLQMPPPKNPSVFPLFHNPQCVPQQTPKVLRTLEEQRAVLGAFFITSTVSHCFKAADGLHWSPHLDDYLSYLAQDNSVSQDHVLVAQVKMQLIINQIRYALRENSNTEVPPSYTETLRSQLDEIAKSINEADAALHNRSISLGLYHYTTLVIHESTLTKSATHWNEPALKRFEVYQRCLNAIKAWLDIFFSLPFETYIILPLSSTSQLFYVLLCLHRITTVKDTAWNSTAAREVVNPLQTLEKIAQIFDKLNATFSLDSPESRKSEALRMGMSKISALRMAWQNELEAKSAETGIIQEADMAQDSHTQFAASPVDYFSFDMLPGLLDERLWQ